MLLVTIDVCMPALTPLDLFPLRLQVLHAVRLHLAPFHKSAGKAVHRMFEKTCGAEGLIHKAEHAPGRARQPGPAPRAPGPARPAASPSSSSGTNGVTGTAKDHVEAVMGGYRAGTDARRAQRRPTSGVTLCFLCGFSLGLVGQKRQAAAL